MKKNSLHFEKESLSGTEFCLEFSDFDTQRSKSREHSDRFFAVNKKTFKNQKNEKKKENES